MPAETFPLTQEPLPYNSLDAYPTVAFLLEYDGRGFCGSQHQRGHSQPTVQGALLAALDNLGVRRQVLWQHLASRTDKSVHARGQVWQLKVQPTFLQCFHHPLAALNAHLPPSVRLKHMESEAWPQGLHCQHGKAWRWYRYQWHCAPQPSPFMPFYATHTHQRLNVAAMQEAAASLVGTYAFTTFKCPKTGVKDDLCTLLHAQVWQPNATTLILDIVGNRFLYKMVRNLAAALWHIGAHAKRHSPNSMHQWLSQQTRSASPYTAPAQGLTLMALAYSPPLPVGQLAQQRGVVQPLFAADPIVQQFYSFLQQESLHDLQNV